MHNDKQFDDFRHKICVYSQSLAACFALFCCFLGSAHAATQWRDLAPGLAYTQHEIGRVGRLHAFRINLDYFDFKMVLARDHQRESDFVRHLAKPYHAWIAINGGFFTPEAKPLGLRVQNGQLRHPLRPISWWGVFSIDHHQAQILSSENYHSKTEFAVQAGPRLIIDGKIPALRPGLADRSAIGIQANGDVILAVTQNAPLSTLAFAELLQAQENENGFACQQALNLDGGHSAQLYSNLPGFSLDVRNFSRVTDAIIVRPREKTKIGKSA